MSVIKIEKNLFRELTTSFMRVSAKIEGIKFSNNEEFGVWANTQMKIRSEVMKSAFMLAVKHQNEAESKMTDNMSFCA